MAGVGTGRESGRMASHCFLCKVLRFRKHQVPANSPADYHWTSLASKCTGAKLKPTLQGRVATRASHTYRQIGERQECALQEGNQVCDVFAGLAWWLCYHPVIRSCNQPRKQRHQNQTNCATEVCTCKKPLPRHQWRCLLLWAQSKESSKFSTVSYRPRSKNSLIFSLICL